MNKISVNKKQYPLKFGLNTSRRLGRKLGIEFHEIEQKIQNILKDFKKGKTTLDGLEFFGEFILQAILEGCRKESIPQPDISIDDMIDLFEDGSEIEKAFNSMSESNPESEDSTTEKTKQSPNLKSRKETVKN